jgi:hypothetical protein
MQRWVGRLAQYIHFQTMIRCSKSDLKLGFRQRAYVLEIEAFPTSETGYQKIMTNSSDLQVPSGWGLRS